MAVSQFMLQIYGRADQRLTCVSERTRLWRRRRHWISSDLYIFQEMVPAIHDVLYIGAR